MLCGSVSVRSIFHGAKSTRSARHGIRTGRPWSFEARAANLSRCWCGRAPADDVGRSAPHVGPQHNHAKSALRGVCSVVGWSVLHPRGEARAGRAPRYSNAVIKTIRSLFCRPIAVLVRSSLGRRHGEERAPRWATTQPRQVHTALRACSVGGRPILPRGEKRAGRAPRDSNAVIKPFEAGAADLSRCCCGRASADGVGRTALAHNTTTPSAHYAARAPWAVGRYSAGRKARGPRATSLRRGDYNLPKPLSRCWCVRASADGAGNSAPHWPTTQPRQVRTARRVLRGRLAGTPRDEKRAGRGPRHSSAGIKTFRIRCRRFVTVLVRSCLG